MSSTIEEALAHHNEDHLLQLLSPWPPVLRSSYDVLDDSGCPVCRPLLVWASALGFARVVELLLSHGEAVNASDAHGWTSLHHAAWISNFEILHKLLLCGANVHFTNEDQSTALHLALERAERNLDGMTVFTKEDLPVSPFKEKVVEALQKHGASLSAQDGCGKTPLMLYDQIGAKFLALDVPLSELSRLLSWPVEERLVKTVEKERMKLKNTGSDIATESEVLFQAAIAGAPRILHALLEKQPVHVKATNGWKRTPLHCAAILGNTDVVKMLVKKEHVDTSAKDKDGKIAADYAREERHQDIENLFEAVEKRQYKDRQALEHLLYKDRKVNVDVAKAILVGAALIATITFVGAALAPSLTWGYASTENHGSARAFRLFNSLSFFCAIAAGVIGARAVLSTMRQSNQIGDAVRELQRAVAVAANLLMVSVGLVVGAFTVAGLGSLPPFERAVAAVAPTFSLASVRPFERAMAAAPPANLLMLCVVFVLGAFGVAAVASHPPTLKWHKHMASLACFAWLVAMLYLLAPIRFKTLLNSWLSIGTSISCHVKRAFEACFTDS